MDFIDAIDDWLEDRWRALRRPLSSRERASRLRWGGVASLSLALHMAVLFYFGSQLTDAYRLPEPPPEIVEPVEPMEAILVPPPEPVVVPEPTPDLRRIEPVPTPAPQPTPAPTPPVPVPTPPAPTPAPTPTPAPPRPTPPTPAPPRPTPPLPFQAAPSTPTVTSANRPQIRVSPTIAPTLPDPAPPVVAPPAPRPAPPAPTPKKDEDDEDKDKPIARNTPPAAAPRQVAPNAAPLTVAPLQMAPTPRTASPAGALPGAGGSNRPPPPGGANGDFTVRPSGQVGGGLRGALRSTVGCDNRNAVALNKGERNNCDESVGVRGADAPARAVGMELDREKADRMRKQVETNEAMRTYKNGTGVGGAAPQSNTAPRVRDLIGGR